MKNLKFKFIVACLLFFVAIFTCYKVYNNAILIGNDVLLFQNVEALANEESGSGQTLDCWDTIHGGAGMLQTHKTYCGSCSAKLCAEWFNASTCKN